MYTGTREAIDVRHACLRAVRQRIPQVSHKTHVIRVGLIQADS